MTDEQKHDINTDLLALYTAKKYDECVEMCKEVLTKNPLNLQALLYMAEISLNRRELNECIRYCDTIIQGVDDRFYPVWRWRGQALCLLKRYEEARVSFETTIRFLSKEDKEEGVFTWSLYALALFMNGEKERAFNLLDMIEEKLEWHGAFALYRGYMERADGNTDEALMQFIQGGMLIDPNSEKYEEDKDLYATEVRDTLERNLLDSDS